MSIKSTNIFHCKNLKNYPTLDFWFENIPSGNPAHETKNSGRNFAEKQLENRQVLLGNGSIVLMKDLLPPVQPQLPQSRSAHAQC
jgi:hypothetical protein